MRQRNAITMPFYSAVIIARSATAAVELKGEAGETELLRDDVITGTIPGLHYIQALLKIQHFTRCFCSSMTQSGPDRSRITICAEDGI